MEGLCFIHRTTFTWKRKFALRFSSNPKFLLKLPVNVLPQSESKFRMRKTATVEVMTKGSETRGMEDERKKKILMFAPAYVKSGRYASYRRIKKKITSRIHREFKDHGNDVLMALRKKPTSDEEKNEFVPYNLSLIHI